MLDLRLADHRTKPEDESKAASPETGRSPKKGPRRK
jgi:hypothetical protein